MEGDKLKEVRMALRISLAIVAALVLPSQALAKIEPSVGGRAALATFNRLDRNRDGGITVAELNRLGKEKAADTLFQLLDVNGNGKIPIKELSANNNALMARLDAYDVNKDGYVTRREFPNWVDPLLVAALDRNHDGMLSLSELRPAFAGAHVTQPAPQPQVRQAAAKKAEPNNLPYCWVPRFRHGDSDEKHHRWLLQGPVVWSSCRTH
jgi:Ca2+-binding EF-hand superfamily protein